MRGRELLSKYIRSGLSNDERFELEKIALDDDFLADAWEGLSHKDTKNAQEILSRLDQQLSTRTPEVKIVPIYRKLWPYAVAASLALVLSVGVLLRSDQGIDTNSMASVSAEQEMVETVNETMADMSNQEESSGDQDIAQAAETIPTKEDETLTTSKGTKAESPAPAIVRSEKVEASGSFASVDLNVEEDNTAGHKILANARGESIDENSLTRSTSNYKAKLGDQSTTTDDIKLKRRTIPEGQLEQKVSISNSAQNNVSILRNDAKSNDPILNGLSKDKLRSLPQEERPVPIPNSEEVKEPSTPADRLILKKLELNRETASADEEVVSVIELDQSFDLGAHIALQDSGDLIVLAEDDGFVAIQDNVDSGLSTQLVTKDLRGANLSSFAPTINDECAKAKEEHKEEYFMDPSPERSKGLYNLLKSNGCPTDGSDSFMTELASIYESWAAEQNAIKPADFKATYPALLASQAYRDGQYEDAIKKYREAIIKETDNTKKAKHHFSIASILFRKLKRYNDSRKEAQTAVSLNPSFGRPYLLIGDMYAVTARSCGDSWNQRLAILAAYDKYAEAKRIDPSSGDEASSKMNKYRSSFPLKDEGFMRGVKAGDQQRVGCWINEVVKVRYRD